AAQVSAEGVTRMRFEHATIDCETATASPLDETIRSNARNLRTSLCQRCRRRPATVLARTTSEERTSVRLLCDGCRQDEQMDRRIAEQRAWYARMKARRAR